RVRRLKPRASVIQVEMDRVRRGQLPIDAVEDIHLIALGVKNDELRRIEEPSCIQAVHLNKVPPVIATVTKIRRAGGRAEGAIRSRNAAGRVGDALARPRRSLNHKTGLPAKLCRGRSRDHLERLYSVGGPLMGDD